MQKDHCSSIGRLRLEKPSAESCAIPSGESYILECGMVAGGEPLGGDFIGRQKRTTHGMQSNLTKSDTGNDSQDAVTEDE